MDLFDSVYKAINPYLIDIAKIAFYISCFSIGLKMIRAKMGNAVGGSNIYSGMVNAFIGYLFCSSISIIINITDSIVADIVTKM